MKGYCCICGDKKPKKVRAGLWISLGITGDPSHQLCGECLKKLKPKEISAAPQHCVDWRRGQVGCRVNDNPKVKQWNHGAHSAPQKVKA